ncbi:MAG: hypothetical protein AB7J28_16770 [Hyphomonadaceae bacterium]
MFDALDFQSRALAVGHPEESLPDIRAAEARNAQIGSDKTISQDFH